MTALLFVYLYLEVYVFLDASLFVEYATAMTHDVNLIGQSHVQHVCIKPNQARQTA